MSDIIVVKGDPSPEELAALAVALLAVATASASPALHQRPGPRRSPVGGQNRGAVVACECR